ncbi:MAG: hypothetical protein M0Z82_17310 [Actinomycetota bacterium]|nr:hypothetical protein [Actinomycetota bacterium]
MSAAFEEPWRARVEDSNAVWGRGLKRVEQVSGGKRRVDNNPLLGLEGEPDNCELSGAYEYCNAAVSRTALRCRDGAGKAVLEVAEVATSHLEAEALAGLASEAMEACRVKRGHHGSRGSVEQQRHRGVRRGGLERSEPQPGQVVWRSFKFLAKGGFFLCSGAVIVPEMVFHLRTELEDEWAQRAVRDGHIGSSVLLV